MKIAALFAGIGGLEFGLQRAGHESLMFSEIWEPAAAVLSKRFPDIPNYGDVALVKKLPPRVDLLTAGFPCQDLSQAGKTAGIGGDRSGLVDHVFRLLDGRRVPWVLLENVSFMLHLDGGRAMNRLVTEFERRNYKWAYRVVNSLGFLPQRRERVFFVASLSGSPEDVLLVDETTPRPVQTDLYTHAHGFYWTEGIRGLGWAPDAVPTLKNGSTVGIASPPAILMPEGMIVKPEIRDAERLQGFPVDWTKPAETVVKPSWRWSLVGNAITVPVAKWAGHRLASPGEYEKSRDRALLGATRWPRAARYDGMNRYAVEISDFPIWVDRPPLTRFLRYPATPLSARATAGFLERTGRSKLRFVDGFRESVRVHLARMQRWDKEFELSGVSNAAAE
jgi:DNA (cytosine-5)-methyltransferase 1